ncbi:MAG: ABC transporter ATP-binding protein/permease [Bacteroidia bacterium]|jgi:ATP-binding cassette subfamily B protein|nr:ABC transporter ATP-binding protein/permease [Bacteroidia bacterium]
MQTLYSYFKKHWLFTGIALLLSAISICFSFLDPHLYGVIINDFITSRPAISDEEFINKMLWLLLGVVGVAMVSRIAKNIQDYMINVIVQKIGAAIYTDGIKQTMELPYQDFEDRRSGETLGILQKVRTDTERFVQSFINIVFSALVGVVFVSWYAWQQSPVIVPVYLAAMPIIAGVSFVLSRRIKTIQKTIVKETTALAGSTTESLRNIELIKGLGLTSQEERRLNGITGRILRLELEKVKKVRTLSFIQGTIINLVRTVLSGIMLWLVWKGELQPGHFFALFLYSFYIFNPLQEIGSFINIWRETQVSFENFNALLKSEKEPRPANPKKLGTVSSIRFSNVLFTHKTAGRAAVNKVSFEVNKGETIAFVGPSGSGKTTIIKLLTGLYRPAEGAIEYNDVKYDELAPEDLRRQIGLVSQDTQLFSGTLRENLLFVKPDATEAQLLDVLHKAACAPILARSDKGLDTVIGEGGIKVSGGERQRIAIARALLRNPSILVFDEATSALDSLTEEEISETIRSVSAAQQQISVLVAHRLSTIMHADRIYVLEKGQVVETGNHHQLIQREGLYAALWRQQAGEELAAV